jgi:uncharacterized protein (TIGR02246 family)
MKWQRIVLMLTILSLLVVPLAWSQGNAEQQVKQVFDQLQVAELKGDSNALEKLYADDYTAIRGDGSLITKAQEIEKMKSGNLKWETNEIKDLKVRVYGNTAITTDLSFVKNVRDGKPRVGTNRTTRVWVKQNGNWKCVVYQSTRVSQ